MKHLSFKSFKRAFYFPYVQYKPHLLKTATVEFVVCKTNTLFSQNIITIIMLANMFLSAFNSISTLLLDL